MLNYNIIKSAIKWKKNEIDKILIIKDNINENTNNKLLDNYINEKISNINKEYELKVNNLIHKNNNKKKDINSFIKNKIILENNYNKKFNTNIETLLNKKYDDFQIENLNFID